jgi:hypothetical protein
MSEPMMILPGGSDFFFSIISAIIRATELDKVVQLHFTDLFSDEFAFNNWGKIFLQYVVEHTTNAPQPSSTSFLSTPSKSRHTGMPIAQPDHNGKIATTIHIAHISHR